LEHDPVLAEQVVDILLPALADGGTVVDATLGRGGHALRILEAAPGVEVVGIDRDREAVEATRANLGPHLGRARLVHENYAQLASVLERLGVQEVRGVLFDLGVASPQLDHSDRGFSFRRDGPLDMRMDTTGRLSADDVVNRYEERELARVIKIYGEERFAHRIARAIVKARPLVSTTSLADVVRNAIPAATRRTGGHPARRTFQAIRIEVNDELHALDDALPAAVDALGPGGRLVVISYHSLEDRRVKRFMLSEERGCTCPPDLPICRCGSEARVRILTRRPLRPSADEIERNPRASAAKLRAAERVTAASGTVEEERRSA
jgi:16S rRNA (cytosine1402-N4)-methyltransferase